MVVSNQRRAAALDATEVVGVGVQAHRFSAPARIRMSDVVGGWYGETLPGATPATRPSGVKARS